MKIISRNKVNSIEDVCGTIRELYSSKNLSISIATITGKSTPHMHKKMEEIYFVLKGKGRIFIGNESDDIKEGNLVAIPQNKFHHVEVDEGETVEVVTVTHPKFDYSDVVKKMS